MTNRRKIIDAGYPREFNVDFMGCPSVFKQNDNNKILKLAAEVEEENLEEEIISKEEESLNEQVKEVQYEWLGR